MLKACIFAFFLTALADVAWTRYTMAVTVRNAGMAAVWSVGIYLMGALVTLTIVSHPIAIAFACAGAALGTYWAVRWKREG